MVERICPSCQHGNPLENRYCGACGASLDRDALVAQAADSGARITLAGRQLPLAQVKQVGAALAVGLATLAAEAGMAYLRRRVDQLTTPGAVSTPSAAERAAPITRRSTHPVADTVTIVSQRVVEIWDQGSLSRQIVEKHVWRREE
jgi:hypothetical protein